MELRDLKDRNVIETANGNFYLVMTLFGNEMRGYVRLNLKPADEKKDPVVSELFEPFTKNFECKENEAYNIVRVYKDFTLKECLAEIVHEKVVLTEAERAYLKTLIAPFANQFEFLMKSGEKEFEYIEISVHHISDKKLDDTVYLPSFKAGTMFNGLKPGKEYTLKDLGINY